MEKNKQMYTSVWKLFLISWTTVMTYKAVVPYLSHSTLILFPGGPRFLPEIPYPWYILASDFWCLESGHKNDFLELEKLISSCLVSTENAKPRFLFFFFNSSQSVFFLHLNFCLSEKNLSFGFLCWLILWWMWTSKYPQLCHAGAVLDVYCPT